MARWLARDSLWSLLVAGTLLGLGLVLVVPRTAGGPNWWLAMSPDALQYIAMVEHRDAAPPFVWRKLVPWLASLLPVDGALGLRLVNYASLMGLYVSGLLLLRARGFTRGIAVVALGCLFASTNHLLFYQNPYLTDAFALLCLMLMTRALFADRGTTFAGLSLVGVLARETCVFLIPAVAARGRWRGLAATAIICAGALFLSRPWPEAYVSYQAVQAPWSMRVLAQLVLSWGACWIVILTGSYLLLRLDDRVAVTALACLGGGALVTSLKAYDVIRMQALTTPVALVATATYFQHVWSRSRATAAGVAVCLGTNVLVAFPETLFTGSADGLSRLEDFYREQAWQLAAVLGTSLAIVATASLKTLWWDARSAPHITTPRERARETWHPPPGGHRSDRD